MITLIRSPGESISSVIKLLSDESNKANNIKSRVNRLSVQAAISIAIERLKSKYVSMHRVPDNGLVIYAGEIALADGKSKLMCIDFVPYKPINTTLYLCDKLFHTEQLGELLIEDKNYGFVVIEGESVCFATLAGAHHTILYKDTTIPPTKTRRGGQSSNRYARQNKEKTDKWVAKAVEQANMTFIKEEKVIVTALVIAGKANTKLLFRDHNKLDPRIKAIMLPQMFDVAYGLSNGLNEAIRLSSAFLVNHELDAQRVLLTSYLNELSKGSGNYSVGVKDTMFALEAGAVKDLIVWDELAISRNTYISTTATTTASSSTSTSTSSSNSTGGVAPTFYCTYTDKDKAVPEKMEIKGHPNPYTFLKSESLIEWLTDKDNRFGCTLHIVSDHTEQGSMLTGLGGIGGLLSYHLDFVSMENDDDDDDNYGSNNNCGGDDDEKVDDGFI